MVSDALLFAVEYLSQRTSAQLRDLASYLDFPCMDVPGIQLAEIQKESLFAASLAAHVRKLLVDLPQGFRVKTR